MAERQGVAEWSARGSFHGEAMNQIDLKGEVAVVTGGAQGIGLAVARRILRSGGRVSLWDVDRAALDKAQTALGGEDVSVEVADVRDLPALEVSLGRTESAVGPVSILVNSAGIAGSNGLIEEYDPDEWRRIVDINLVGTFHMNRIVLPGMKARNYGRIVNIASIAGKEGNPSASAYSASKAGVIALTKSAGKEAANFDIAVNCITPAAARTRIFDQMQQSFIDYMLSKIPRGRFLEVEEVASMVAWLVSRENSFTTGGVFDLSGGRATY